MALLLSSRLRKRIYCKLRSSNTSTRDNGPPVRGEIFKLRSLQVGDNPWPLWAMGTNPVGVSILKKFNAIQRKVLASSKANWLPTQARTPNPNGAIAFGWRVGAPGKCRSGLNTHGSPNKP